MKVRALLISENFPPDRGGMAQSADRIVRGLRARGVVVDVAHFNRRPGELAISVQVGGRLISCPVDEDHEHAINRMWLALKRESYTAVLAFGGLLPLLSAPVFAAWWNLPLVTLLRGNDFDTGIVSLRRGWLTREALARSARVVAVSRDQQRKVEALFPQTPVRYIANGIDAAGWQLHDFDRRQAAAWRAANVTGGRRVIGLFGHIKRKKGGDLLVDALADPVLARRVHLLVVGEIESVLADSLAALPELALTRQPFVDRLELLPWYAACDLIAVPSLYDGMPNVVLEAGALGVPVLASDAGGLADLLLDGVSALVFAAGDRHGCHRALERATTLPCADLAALGAALAETVGREHRAEREAGDYEALLRELDEVVLNHRTPSTSAVVERSG